MGSPVWAYAVLLAGWGALEWVSMTDDDIEFRGHPASRLVEVVCGLPRRPRSLPLYVGRDGAYSWGVDSAETRQLARGIIVFACMQYHSEPGARWDSPGLVAAFVRDKLLALDTDRSFTIGLSEVYEWLTSMTE